MKPDIKSIQKEVSRSIWDPTKGKIWNEMTTYASSQTTCRVRNQAWNQIMGQINDQAVNQTSNQVQLCINSCINPLQS